MSTEIDLLKLVCRKLDEAHIAYMLTGSLAANFYATPRMTRDIDIVLELGGFELLNFCKCFEKDFYFSKQAAQDAIENQGMFNIIHNEWVYKVDFIIRKDSPYRATEFKRKKRIEIDGAPIWIVAPEDLIISKLFWAKDSESELQTRDIRNLLSSLKNFDEQYVKTWVQKLGLLSIYQKVLS